MPESARHWPRNVAVVAIVLALAAIAFVSIPRVRDYLTGAAEPSAPSRSAPSHVVAAAGDIACATVADDHGPTGGADNGLPTADTSQRTGTGRPAGACAARATADLLRSIKPDAVLALGDLQYECGGLSDFRTSYAVTWGQFLNSTHPVLGNHEYGRGCGRNSARSYFDYFGARAGLITQGWYSYDVGSWHLVALNSECSYGEGAQAVGGCDAGSEQERWLRRDLAQHPTSCTLAYWHEPRFSSGQHGSAVQMTDLWNALVDAHVDIVLSGHNHVYERFEPLGRAVPVQRTGSKPVFQDPTPDPEGIQQFVVGTGGKNHYPFKHEPLAGEAARDDTTFGVLSLTLKPDSYDWKFVPVKDGLFHDSGSATCR